MFGLARRKDSYRTKAVENVIGIGLPNRSRFINYGDIAAENVYSGVVIGRVFAEDPERLSFEFDAVYLHYLIIALADAGILDDQGIEALQAVFDNFGLEKVEQDKFYERLRNYDVAGDEVIAEMFIDNLSVPDFPERLREPSRKILGKQFHALSKVVSRFVRDELKAFK